MKEIPCSLFTETQNILQAGAFISALKAAMRRVADASKLSREQITDVMNAITDSCGKRLTGGRAKHIHTDTLDKWLAAEETDHVPGLLAVHVFCLATGSRYPLEVWLAALGAPIEVMTAEDKMYRDYGRSMLEKKRSADKARKMELKLQEELQ